MNVYTDILPCRTAVRGIQRNGGTVGLVPTMGAIHEGHVSLIRAAKARCSHVAVTIFVNPTQFAPTDDFTAYPRPLEADLDSCKRAGVDLVFTPTVETMYPGARLESRTSTNVHVSGLTDVLCGPRRPGHFDGVATIVAKLFGILPADAVFFGEKDYQQLAVIRQMVRDLNIPIEIVGCPTVREPDGLAMSSRNAYLTSAQRTQATCLSRALFDAAERIRGGERNIAAIVDGIREGIVSAGPAQIEYVDVVDSNTLDLLSIVDRPARICLAVRIGSCRLIDNVGVDAPPTPR
jgi:pantoate--beta-alanine ligase